MIGAIASTLGRAGGGSSADSTGDSDSRPVCVVEAGTGTGKTLAYLLASLPIAEAQGKTLVVSTGTVSLQSQLVDKDIPELIAATGWNYRFALAKGRGRYLCPLRLEQCSDAVSVRNAGLFQFEDELPFHLDVSSSALIDSMEQALAAGDWDGDRDTWPQAVPESQWRALTVDRRQCGGHRCRKFSQCCFFRAREDMAAADCIIANHDLVLADLALGGGAILPSPEDCIFIFDEAHRLADTTLRHFAGNFRLLSGIRWLEQVQGSLGQLLKQMDGETGLRNRAASVGETVELALTRLRQATPVLRQELDNGLAAGSDLYRYAGGDIGASGRQLCSGLQGAYASLATALAALGDCLEEALENPHHSLPRAELENLFQGLGHWSGRVDAAVSVWQLMATADPVGDPPCARWLSTEAASSDEIVISVSPIAAASLLQQNLWVRCHGAVATSATLRALGSFDRFLANTGISGRARCLAVPGAFDFNQCGTLAVPDIGADGGDQVAHTRALGESLEGLIDRSQGTLVLFASRRQMEDVYARVPDCLRQSILLQGELSHSEIVRRHRQRIDRGEGGVIFGLASFAEGMDLPGAYCSHVIIAKLPFAVPDDPLQSAQAEWLETQGHNAFRAMTLPDTSLRLIQACGRLLRTEQDRGRVTILDRRLLTKYYGRLLLDALPPFRREFS